MDATIKKCSFDYMKQYENKFDFITEVLLQRGYKLSSFLREGEIGKGETALSQKQEVAFMSAANKKHRYPDFEFNLPQFLH
jgi:hypothetical protein